MQVHYSALLKSGKKFRILWTFKVLTFETNSTLPQFLNNIADFKDFTAL